MKPQKHDLTTNNRFKTHKIWALGLILMPVFYFQACHNDIDRINELVGSLDYPDQSGRNIEVQYTDSAKLQVIFRAPKMEHYLNLKEEGPCYEFAEGIEVEFYDEYEKLESVITAGYAIHYEDENLWKARDSVVARNAQTFEELNTEEIFWDQKNKKIYSNVFTKITNEEGVFYGEDGFESDQDLSNYILKGSSGTVAVDDEEFE